MLDSRLGVLRQDGGVDVGVMPLVVASVAV